MRREPEVPEERVPVVECLDGPARITSKELAPIHSVKSGTLQNACSTRPRVVADLGKSARMHIVDKSAVAMLKKNDVHESTWQPVVNRDESHDRPGRPDVKRDTCHKLKHKPVGHRSSNTRQLGCVFQEMKPPKPIFRKSSDMQKPIQRVKFTKALVHHTKIRNQNPRSDFFAQVNLISAAPTLQILRIGLRRRQSGKSKVPTKQRGSVLKIKGARKSYILVTFVK